MRELLYAPTVTSAVVTITVTGDEAAACLGAGQRFTLWSGGDVGQGIISRRAWTEHGPS
jgi:hypothetical protein